MPLWSAPPTGHSQLVIPHAKCEHAPVAIDLPPSCWAGKPFGVPSRDTPQASAAPQCRLPACRRTAALAPHSKRCRCPHRSASSCGGLLCRFRIRGTRSFAHTTARYGDQDPDIAAPARTLAPPIAFCLRKTRRPLGATHYGRGPTTNAITSVGGLLVDCGIRDASATTAVSNMAYMHW